MKQTVIYEVRIDVDPEIEQEFDLWLTDHIKQMLLIDGFISAEVLVPEQDQGNADHPTNVAKSSPSVELNNKNPIVRLVQYEVASRQQLERYFDEHAARMREQGVQHFGDAFSASRTIYDVGTPPTRVCQNCGEKLRGQYCEECGQRDSHRIISLWELLRDLVGDLFEIDSRVWRTLFPLLFRPGQLTIEYLRGRRVRYTPPLRLYLISSLVFFLVVFFNTTPDLTVDGKAANIEEVVAAIEKSASQPDEGQRPAASTELPETTPSTESALSVATDPDTDDDSDSETMAEKCAKITIDGSGWGEAVETRAQDVCLNLTADGGVKRFISKLIDNTPGMMFIFLPVIALIMVFLYPLSRRYYVEHLLFFVHFHSFFFLLFTLTVLFDRMPQFLPGQSSIAGLLSFSVVLYIPVYLFIAMRRVYGQSRALTALKYTVLGVAYFASLLISFITMALFTALSV